MERNFELEPIHKIIISIIALVFSIICIRDGWMSLRFGKAKLDLFYIITFRILGIFKEKEFVEKRKQAMIELKNKKIIGYLTFFGGIIYFLLFLFLIMDVG